MANPSTDRQITSVPYPETHILTEDELFNSSTGLPSISRLQKHLQNGGRVDERCASRLAEAAHQIFRSEPNIVKIEQPVTIVGDIHGQFYDFITILSLGGEPATTRYLFLGDYVDRGQFQCECLFLLFALKIKYPKNITLLRG
jgi:serine/threonine-protein phosphatase 2B catalytic subunit